ncbi:MAG TPA: DUF1499 domain-containing protein [Limnobacter sp.]|nr:DUF1499 domain-containing protein [Limnobacter sp.]
MKKAFGAIVVLAMLTAAVFFGLGMYSQTGSPPGLQDGKLRPCPNSPNCVSSESAPSDDHAIAAISLSVPSGADPMIKVRDVVKFMGGEVLEGTDTYLATTFTSAIFGFVDDVEFRLDQGSNLIHVRSASRVGYSDFNANKQRVEQIRHLLTD